MSKDLPSLAELSDNFSLFDDWEDRYRYLIDLGRDLPHLEDAYKADEYLVRGCTSRVWLVPHVDGDVLTFEADSDAHIVRGLIALLMVAFNGKTLEQVRQTDIEKTFREIGLDQHLSPNRRNGFYAMVERIKTLAA